MSENVEKLYNEYWEAAKRLTDAMRQEPPEPVGDYTFKTRDGSVSLKDLFGGRDELLLITTWARRARTARCGPTG